MAWEVVRDGLNKEKFKAVLLYIISRCENKPNVKTNQMLEKH